MPAGVSKFLTNSDALAQVPLIKSAVAKSPQGRSLAGELPFIRALIRLSLLVCLAIGLNATAYGQCPEPWYSANTVYRTINAQGSGTASVDGVTQTTNQSITFALNLLGYYPGTCSGSAWPGTGTAANRASINDVVVGAGGVCTTTAQADGSGSPLVALAISGTNTYSFNATDNLDGKVIYTGDPLSCNPRTQDETIGWGPGGLPGPTPQFFPWPSSASMSGNFTFSAIPGDNISSLVSGKVLCGGQQTLSIQCRGGNLSGKQFELRAAENWAGAPLPRFSTMRDAHRPVRFLTAMLQQRGATKCDDFRDLSRAPAAPPASGPKPIKTALRCGAPPVRCP